ncbi:MAG: 2-iminoacetate synthase ThiH [Firmicutes bacterium]|nr:2-iminoacetate synthase ThiH [Bacillota bacterium]
MSNIINKVLAKLTENYFDSITPQAVETALGKDILRPEDFAALLSSSAEPFLEKMAQRAKKETQQHFGNAVSLYTPLYLSNHCDNSCTYCGFSCNNKIKRGKLSENEIKKEFAAISKTGLKEILLLTGESRENSPPEYIARAVSFAKDFFTTIGVEIYPLEIDEYKKLQQAGADFVSVYQETYDVKRYSAVHPKGAKSKFDYRFDSHERALEGGMRGVSFGALLGLGDFRFDAFAAGLHAFFVQQKFPHAEIAFSVPRLRTFSGGEVEKFLEVRERQLFQVLCAYRIFMPFATITISTRERAEFRDRVIGVAANKMSAGVKVGVGGHDGVEKGGKQFEICDERSVSEIHDAIIKRGLQPVYADHIKL